MCAYRQITTYQFTCGGYVLEATDWGNSIRGKYLVIEETAKNGQEDTHMTGVAVKPAGFSWQWCSEEGNGAMFAVYGSDQLRQDILDFLNENPPDFI